MSFGDKIEANPPELLEELVGYAATMADYLTRIQNQDKSVEQLGKAMIEVTTVIRDGGIFYSAKNICTNRILSHLCHKWLMTQGHNVTTLI